MSMKQTSLLVSTMLSFMHPAQYHMGISCIEKLPQHCGDHDAVETWNSVFNSLQVISNRETPLHRDNGSMASWFDVLVTVGPYKSAKFCLPGVGLPCRYDSGTMMALSGRVLQHGVTDIEGERICIANYMRKNVQERVETSLAGWSYLRT